MLDSYKDKILKKERSSSKYWWLMTVLLAVSFLAKSQKIKAIKKEKDNVTFQLSHGMLVISPLSNSAVRTQFFPEEKKTSLQELVFVENYVVPIFIVTEKKESIEIALPLMKVSISKSDCNISYFDKNNNLLLEEKAGSRSLTKVTDSVSTFYAVNQAFESPLDESIFGLGQFQDGLYNLKGFTRKLTQVNTQISIPFIYSDKGYAMLWQQYGLTDFNPADNVVKLSKLENKNDSNAVVVTTSAGTQKITQSQSLYKGNLVVDKEGEYGIFLDLGSMGNRHFVAIDGKPVIDQTNRWLPPTVGTKIHLAAGEHTFEILCDSKNLPVLSYRLADNTTTFRSPNAQLIDYTIFAGKADKVIADYRKISGNVPMLPLWAYGYWQCKERYHSSDELISAVQEFRKRNLPLDVIVQDWQYWGKYGWGAVKFDETYYPDPAVLMKDLHKENAHLSISVWENVDKNSAVGKAYVKQNLYIPNSLWLDMTNPKAQKAHWDALDSNMNKYEIDSWWADATEPENDALAGTKTFLGPGNFYRLTYPLFLTKAIYEGQRKSSPEKRVAILTRSAFAGQQRYGTINWSGDIGCDWDAYKRQIVAGLNYSITGMPYWTTDIGGFFRPGKAQYTDTKYHELLIRWFQWGALNPIFRLHGYQTNTEPWYYGDTVVDNFRKTMNLRYRLMPYIYSQAWQVSKNGSTIMRPMVMDFPSDKIAVASPYEYMFGASMLVAPIIKAGVNSMEVYLPKAEKWYDFWSGQSFAGGQSISTSLTLDKIPIYIKAGSILPLGKTMQYTSEKPMDNLEIRIYKGADGYFELYQDDGVTYAYENGASSVIPFNWNNKTRTLTIGERKGSFPTMLKKIHLNIVSVGLLMGNGIESGYIGKSVDYTGKSIKMVL